MSAPDSQQLLAQREVSESSVHDRRVSAMLERWRVIGDQKMDLSVQLTAIVEATVGHCFEAMRKIGVAASRER